MEPKSTETMSYDEMAKTIDKLDSELSTHEFGVQRAREQFVANTTPSVPGSDDDEGRAELIASLKQRLEEEHLPSLTEREDAAIRRAQEAVKFAADVMRAADEAAPVLSGGERVQADALRGFVKDQVETAPLRLILAELRSALHRGDRAALYVYQAYLPARLDKTDLRQASNTERRELAELREALRLAREQLADPTLPQLRKAAVDLRYRAEKLQHDAEARRKPKRRYGWETDRDVPWTV